MSFLDQVDGAREVLRGRTRVSLQALRLELSLSDEECNAVVAELVDAQQTARLEGQVLIWRDPPGPYAGDADRRRRKRRIQDYTPQHLADKILSSRSAMEGEKKQVTVLFCDVANSMDLAASLGAEEWHDVLDAFFRVLTDAVHEYEGTVNQYTGDGIMALFGAPIGHEDHAVRAAHAALQIQQDLATLRETVSKNFNQRFAARIGLNSGEVVVGRIGDDLRMDYTAQGQVVGIAARLEGKAEPDSVYLSPFTAGQIEGFFELASQGQQDIKGVNRPLEIFRLGLPRDNTDRFEVTRRRGLTRFVGRERELEILNKALRDARHGDGCVVGVVADAGSGKSRLCFEFLESRRSAGDLIIKGHAIAHGQNIPLHPLKQIMRAYFGLEEAMPHSDARQRIAARLDRLRGDYAAMVPVLCEFLDIKDPEQSPLRMDPDAKLRQLFNLNRDIVGGADPEITRIIACVEDLHWLDAGTEAFIEAWVEALQGSKFFLLVNFRPGYQASWMDSRCYRHLPLEPLAESAMQDMLETMMGNDPGVLALSKHIIERTGGNPFYGEEVVRTLVETGGLQGQPGSYTLGPASQTFEIPASVQSVIAARIDRLSDLNKSLLQHAAVIGRTFDLALLAASSGVDEVASRTALEQLVDSGFIRPLDSPAGRDFLFVHALTQEVALRSQLKDRLLNTHARVAHALENTHSSRLDEHAALIAHHWASANEPLTAAEWYCRAADHACKTNIRQGVAHMQTVLRLTDDLPDTEQRIMCRLRALPMILQGGAWRISMSPQELEKLAEEGRQFTTALNETDAAANIQGGYAATIGISYGDVQTWGRLMDELGTRRDSLSAATRQVQMGSNLGYSLFIRGQLEQALKETAAVNEELGDDFVAGIEIAAFSALGQILTIEPQFLAYLGRFEEAIDRIQAGIRRTTDKQLFEERLWARGVLPEIYYLAGMQSDWPGVAEAISEVERAYREAEMAGSGFTIAAVGRGAGLAMLLSGRAADAAALFEELHAHCLESHSYLEGEASMLAFWSECARESGDPKTALDTAEQAVAIGRKQGAAIYELRGCLALSRALTEEHGRSKAAEIEQALQRAESLARAGGAKGLMPQVIEERGSLHKLLGDNDTSETLIGNALSLYRETGALGHVRRLESA